MHTSTTLRFFVPLLLSALAGCGPDVAPDYWGALPTPAVLEVPRPYFAARGLVSGGDLGVLHLVSTADAVMGPSLELVNTLTADKEPEVTPAGLEWRSSPGLADSVVWRLVLENMGNAWSDPERLWGPVKPAQHWKWRVELRPKMAADAAFRVVMEGTRETPVGDMKAARGSGAIRVDWRAACEVLARTACPGGDAGRSSLHASFTLGDGSRTLALELVRILPGVGGDVTATTAVDGTIDATGAGTLRTSELYAVPDPRPWNAVPYSRRLQWGADGSGRMDYSGIWTSSDGTWGVGRTELCWNADRATVYLHEYDGPGAADVIGSTSACGNFAQVEPLP